MKNPNGKRSNPCGLTWFRGRKLNQTTKRWCELSGMDEKCRKAKAKIILGLNPSQLIHITNCT